MDEKQSIEEQVKQWLTWDKVNCYIQVYDSRGTCHFSIVCYWKFKSDQVNMICASLPSTQPILDDG